MSLTLNEMRTLVRRAMGDLDSADMPDSEVDQYINMAYWAIEDQFPFRTKECFRTTTTTDGQASYQVPSDLDAILGVFYKNDNDKWTRLDRMSKDWYWDELDEDAEEEGEPEKYMRVDDGIYLWPTPDDAYELGLFSWEELTDLTADTDNPDLPRNWHEILVDEAIVRALKYHGDINQAQQFANFPLQERRQAVLDRTKEEADSESAGVRVRREGIGNWR